MPVFIIAEAGVNHNGDEALALGLIDAAAEAGADAVKFQTFSADRLVTADAAKAAYQERHTGEGSQYGMLKRLELTRGAHLRLADRCAERGIEFMSTPFDRESADFLVEAGVRRLKIPSGELTNHPFLDHLAGFGRPLILSTGMATLDEILEAIEVIRRRWAARDPDTGGAVAPLTVLHCTSDYPASPDDVNLHAMATIRHATGLPVGYSDHTEGIAVATAAVALGAQVIEKHLTLDRGFEGPDHAASLEPGELAAMVEQIRTTERALGSAVKAPSAAELQTRAIARRSVVAARDLEQGARLSAEDVAILRPGTGIPPKHHAELPGRRVRRPIRAGTPLQWSDLD